MKWRNFYDFQDSTQKIHHVPMTVYKEGREDKEYCVGSL